MSVSQNLNLLWLARMVNWYFTAVHDTTFPVSSKDYAREFQRSKINVIPSAKFFVVKEKTCLKKAKTVRLVIATFLHDHSGSGHSNVAVCIKVAI